MKWSGLVWWTGNACALACCGLPWSACRGLLACSLSVSLSLFLSSSLFSLSLSVLALPSFWGSIRCRREMSRWRNPATCCQGTLWSRCRGGRVALSRLIRFRFGKAMGPSGAGPSRILRTYSIRSPSSHPTSQPSLSLFLSCCLATTVKLLPLGNKLELLLRISGAPGFPIPERLSGYSHLGTLQQKLASLSPGPRCPCPLAVHSVANAALLAVAKSPPHPAHVVCVALSGKRYGLSARSIGPSQVLNCCRC